MQQIFYAVTYNTESGDEGFVGVFKQKPSDEDLLAMAKETYPDEVYGDDVTIYFSVFETVIEESVV